MWKSMHHDQIKLWNPIISKLLKNYIDYCLTTSSSSTMLNLKLLHATNSLI